MDSNALYTIYEEMVAIVILLILCTGSEHDLSQSVSGICRCISRNSLYRSHPHSMRVVLSKTDSKLAPDRELIIILLASE